MTLLQILQLSNFDFFYIGKKSLTTNFHYKLEALSSFNEFLSSGGVCFFESLTPKHIFKNAQVEESKKYLSIKICSTSICLKQIPAGKNTRISYSEMDLKNENGLLGVQMNRIAQMVNRADNAFLVVNLDEYGAEHEHDENEIKNLDPFWSLLRLLNKVNLVVFENSCNIQTNKLKVNSNSFLFLKLSEIVLKQ